ncbi:hypothetical protein A6R68_15904, partial [Neotoma lepida]
MQASLEGEEAVEYRRRQHAQDETSFSAFPNTEETMFATPKPILAQYILCTSPDRQLIYMEPENHTGIPEFYLLGLSENPEIQSALFGLFLSLYLVTISGNLLIILAIVSDPKLHTPMYLFLSNLSFSDICFTSTTVPKMLLNIQTQSKRITYAGCITQMYFFTVFGLLDNLLLTVMAYDRFVAICHPLHYTVLMSPKLCSQLLLLAWLISILGALPESLTALRLSFCAIVEIPHYFCELPEVLKLACSDTFINNVVLYI